MRKIRKVGISFLASILFITLNSFQALASVEELNNIFTDAFNSVKKVIEIGNQNNVRPLNVKFENSLDPGVSDVNDVEKAVKEGLQVAINDARGKLDKFPSEMDQYKSTFSAILDNYQASVFEVVQNIIKNCNSNPRQSDIIIGRNIIKDIDKEYKACYSIELDKLQNKILSKAVNLVEIAEKSENIEDFKLAQDYIKDIKLVSHEFYSEDIINFVLDLELRINKDMNYIKVKEIVNMPYFEIYPDNMEIELPVAIPEGYRLYITFDWIKDVLRDKPTENELKNSYLYKAVEGDGLTKKVTIPLLYNNVNKKLLPVQGNYLIYLVNKETSNIDYISKNSIRLSLGVESFNTNDKIQSDLGNCKTELTIKSKAKYTGYLVHEVISKNKNCNIMHNILVNAEETPEIIADRIRGKFEAVSQRYMSGAVSKSKDGKVTIGSFQSEEIRSSIK